VGNPSLVPEAALQLFHAFVYCMAYISVGGAVIVLSVYIVLVCSEMFSSEPRSKTQRAKARQSARRVPVAEETLVLSSTERVILSAREDLGKEAVRVTPPPHGAQIPMTVPANLEIEPRLP
jgi:hypothetical protein